MERFFVALLTLFMMLMLIGVASFAFAQEPNRFVCPDRNPCRVIILNEQEVNALLGERGVLQTAAAARALDLAGVVTYFQNKIANAQRGELPPEPPKPDEPKKD